MATGTLLVLLDANNKAQNMQAVLNDLTIAIDSMTREVRTGYNYVCADENTPPSTVPSLGDTADCVSGNYLSIIEAGDSLTGGGNPRVSYYYDDDPNARAIFRRIGTGDWIQLTARNLRITDAEFVVTGTDSFLINDLQQPSVTIFVAGEAGDLLGLDSDFVLQTTVVQRPLDI